MSGGQGDRVDVELPDALRDETGAAPVVRVAGELNARAGSRGRFRGWLASGRVAVATLVVGIVGLGVLAALNPTKPVSTVGGSSFIPAFATAPAAPPSASDAGPTVSASQNGVRLGTPGDVIVARVHGDRLEVVAVHPNRSETSLGSVPSLSKVLGAARIARVPYGAFARNGWIAITFEIGGPDTLAFGTVMIDLIRPERPPIFNDSERYGFLPDGTYVSIGEASEQEVSRWAPPYDRDRLGTIFPDHVFQAAPAAASLSILPDATGIHLAEPVDGPNGDALPYFRDVAMRWDGTTTPADSGLDPLGLTGADRAFGAHGETAFRWSDSGSAKGSAGLAVEGPTTPRVETKVADPVDFAWAPGGRTLYIVTSTTVLGFDGGTTTKVVDLNRSTDGRRIVGFTPDSILLGTKDGDTDAVSLDGSNRTDSLGGFLLGVIG